MPPAAHGGTHTESRLGGAALLVAAAVCSKTAVPNLWRDNLVHAMLQYQTVIVHKKSFL